MRILVTAAGSPQAVGIIRHLKEVLDHYVIGCDIQKWGAGNIFCDQWHVAPPAYLTDYPHFITSLNYSFRIPFLDEDLYIGGPRVLLSPASTIAIFTDKLLQQRAMENASLPIAPLAEEREKAIFKPRKGRGGKGCYVIPGHDIRVPRDGIYQKFIEGTEYTIDCLCDRDGDLLFAVPRERIAVSGGVSTIGHIWMGDEALLTLAKRVCRMFHFIGPINIQVIRDRDGLTWITEVNPRLSGSCMFTVIAGWDILAATIRLFEGLPFVPPQKVYDVHVRRYYTEVRA